MELIQPFLGILLIIAFGTAASRNRSAINWKLIAGALFIQFALAILFLKAPGIASSLGTLNKLVTTLESATLRATQFLFGYLAGGAAPFTVENEGANFIIAFRVLPLIIVISALSSLLFHLGILPFIIRTLAKLLEKTLRISGPLSFGSASTLFLGTIEAPLLIRPYLQKLSSAELLMLFSCTMATIAGTVMILYASVVGQVVENSIAHMITASIISIPAAILISALVAPLSEQTAGDVNFKKNQGGAVGSLIEGTSMGLQMVLQIIATLLVMFALIYLINDGIAMVAPGHSLQSFFGTLLRPILWCTGIEWNQTSIAGQLMGTKIILNEFVAYLEMNKFASEMTPRTSLVMTYACCGFANLGSFGIVVGGMTKLIPERSSEISRSAAISVIIGNFATLMTASVVAILA